MGPLDGLKIIELGALGPAPFCAMMLGDMGAEVIRIDRASADAADPVPTDCTLRNRRSIALNLKNPAAVDVLLQLVEVSDVLLEGYRPGVAERLGIGPEICLSRNPRLVYGRMTGWGQTGPLASAAGRDINYISLTGALHMIGEPSRRPVPPLNLVGDTGGGGMLLVSGILAALVETSRSGKGQIVDAAMVDGALALMAFLHSMRHSEPNFRDETGEQMLAGAAPFYTTYETKDGKYVAVGAIDRRSYELLLEFLEVDRKHLAAAHPGSRTYWPEARAAIAKAIRSKTREEVVRIASEKDCCLTPVLTMAEAIEHPHNQAREAFVTIDGVIQHAPVPRFSRTSLGPVDPPRRPGADTRQVLRDMGFGDAQIEELQQIGALS